MCEVRSVKSERNGFMWTVICDMSSCLAADINIVFTTHQTYHRTVYVGGDSADAITERDVRSDSA